MNNKTLIVFKREYFTRLKSKAFIISTILAPIALAAIITIPIAATVLLEDDTRRVILVSNEASLDLNLLDIPGDVEVSESSLELDSLRTLVRTDRIDAYLLLPEGIVEGTAAARYVSRGGSGLQFRFALQNSIKAVVRDERLRRAGANTTVLDILNSDVGFEGVRLTDEGEGVDATGTLSLLGYAMALVIYICVFLYGSLVMRSVIEEKTNRIVEIVVSSVRPFQLMLGKVLGVGAIGLTQIFIWIVALFVFVAGLGTFLGASGAIPPPEATALTDPQVATGEMPSFDIPHLPLSLVVYSVLFFLGGYLLYASLFATIGSVVEQESDAQQFMLPIAVPIILSLMFIGRVVESPGSTLSVIASYIPLFSPILMPVRGIVSPLPLWEIPLSLALLFATFGGVIWFCARVYRVGILMYGKRPGFSDILKWARMD